MITIEYFVIMAEKDQCEGRGGLEETSIYFLNYQDALEFTKRKEMQEFTVMGHVRAEGHKELIKEKTTIIFDNLNEYTEQYKNKLKQQALAKLTLEEKRILGLV